MNRRTWAYLVAFTLLCLAGAYVVIDYVKAPPTLNVTHYGEYFDLEYTSPTLKEAGIIYVPFTGDSSETRRWGVHTLREYTALHCGEITPHAEHLIRHVVWLDSATVHLDCPEPTFDHSTEVYYDTGNRGGGGGFRWPVEDRPIQD